MPLQNRVLPTGEIVVHPARGGFTGNRGILHRADETLGASRWTHKHWLVCSLTHPRGRYHGPMPARRWTALFFLDEAVALAAGHRPCHYCRRGAYRAFVAAWVDGTGRAHDRMAMDSTLHGERTTRHRAQVRHQAALSDLPDGSFVLWQDRPHLVRGDRLLPFRPDGYGAPVMRPPDRVTVLTPRSTVRALAAGYAPVLHPSADGSAV